METIIRFDKVSFIYGDEKVILDSASFSVRRGMKVALMGQNGAGKSTLFKLLTGVYKPKSGQISVDPGQTIATAHQVISPEDKELTVEQYFSKWYKGEHYEVKSRMSKVLEAVNLNAPADKLVKAFSGGQQARLLLASALIQNPDLLLLDEPTNNLDYDGIAHLTDFLINYNKSVIVISHDAEFLNAFTQGVLYLDSWTKQVEQYAGNYHDVVADIQARIDKQNSLNAAMERTIRENKEKANYFANKGGKMRNVAKKMREKIEQLEEDKIDVRKEDKTIRPFTIPAQEGLKGEVLKINSYTVMQNHQPVKKEGNVFLLKDRHMILSGPNGIGKSSLIKSIMAGTAEGIIVTPGVRVGYYSQDFSTLNYEDTVWETLAAAIEESGGVLSEHKLRAVAAGFLITKEHIHTQIKYLSEGQKGLVSFAKLVLMEPGLLILDEPTNHINFRHLPVIAKALDEFKGALLMVSHVWEFVAQIRIDEELDLSK